MAGFVSGTSYKWMQMKYLGLFYFIFSDPYDPVIAAQIGESSQLNTNDEKKPEMLPETKELLDQFYKPYNQQLAQILHDDNYLNW